MGIWVICMEKENRKMPLPQEDVMKILVSCYEKYLHEIPKVRSNAEDMAEEYYGNRNLHKRNVIMSFATVILISAI